MKVQIVVSGGAVRLMTKDGSFSEGRAQIESLLALLRIDGVDLLPDGPVEQHRHGPEGEHVNEHHNQ